MSDEIFEKFPIEEYINHFTVSNKGRIYSNRKRGYLKNFISNSHNVVNIQNLENGISKQFRIDKIVADVFCEKNGDFLWHKDGNELNDDADNLEWTTVKKYLKKLFGIKWSQIQDMSQYYISTDGRVWSVNSMDFIKQRVIAGYQSVNIGYPKQKFYHVHRLVASAFCKNPNNVPIVNHKNCNKMDNNATNLEWVTTSQNNQHAVDNLCRKKTRSGIIKTPCTEICVELDWMPGIYILDDGRVYNSNSQSYCIQHLNGSGYRRIQYKRKLYFVHKLVAEAYLFNTKKPEHTQVNHKNGNREDNNYTNLEYCTAKENVAHSKSENKEQFSHLQKSVAKICRETDTVLEIYKGVKEASRQSGVNSGSIVQVCKGRKLSAGGFKWKYHN